MSTEKLSRRRLLGIGATALPVALAGCMGGGGGGGDGGESPDNTVIVGPDNQFIFEPDSLTVSPGTEVTWEWASNTHNVVPESQPEGSNWSGTEGGESQTFDEGYVYSHTFQEPGTYSYYCSPHRSQGMVGEIVVEE